MDRTVRPLLAASIALRTLASVSLSRDRDAEEQDLRVTDNAAGDHQELQLPLQKIDVTYRRVQTLREKIGRAHV